MVSQRVVIVRKARLTWYGFSFNRIEAIFLKADAVERSLAKDAVFDSACNSYTRMSKLLSRPPFTTCVVVL